jgi:hypothetical protein
MKKSKQRFVVKFLFLKSLDSKVIHIKLIAVLGSIACSLIQIKEWRARFETSNLSCDDQSRPGHPPHVWRKALSDFLQEFPFATAGIIAQHFD